MSNDSNYTQCDLRSGTYFYTTWIPTKFAQINKKITIDDLPGTWTVVARWETMLYDYVNAKSQEYKHAFASIEDN